MRVSVSARPRNNRHQNCAVLQPFLRSLPLHPHYLHWIIVEEGKSTDPELPPPPCRETL